MPLNIFVQFPGIFGWDCFPPTLLIYLFFISNSFSILHVGLVSNFVDLKYFLLLRVNCQKQPLK